MKSGQTLLEVIVVIGVVVILSMSLVILTTISLKRTRLGKLRGQAVIYAQEGMEFVRQKRDKSWTDFQVLGGTWCLGDGGVWVQQIPCGLNVANLFDRLVDFTWNETDKRMEVAVWVTWYEGGDYYQTSLQSYFTEQ